MTDNSEKQDSDSAFTSLTGGSLSFTCPVISYTELQPILEQLAKQEKWDYKYVQKNEAEITISYLTHLGLFRLDGPLNIDVTLVREGERTKVTIASQNVYFLKTFYDWGNNRQNIEKVFNYLQAYLLSKFPSSAISEPTPITAIPITHMINFKALGILMLIAVIFYVFIYSGWLFSIFN